jgi:hypothetical protein
MYNVKMEKVKMLCSANAMDEEARRMSGEATQKD